MLLLNKLLPWFVLPLGGSLILIVWGLARRRKYLGWAGAGLLLLSTNPLVGNFFMRSAENWAERRPVAQVSTTDAIVVLSAGRIVAPGPERVSEWGDGDRFFSGVELFRAGKAPLLVFTGGALASEPMAPLEGSVLAVAAVELGVPAERIVVTAKVANTSDEAAVVGRLLHDRGLITPRVLLVTSAFHMSRARQLFEDKGLFVEPFPVDFRVSHERRLSPLDFLPDIGALAYTQTALRELYGRAFYWAIERVR